MPHAFEMSQDSIHSVSTLATFV